mmetsp:Transcript_35817/g.45981  ORF Transcript_35817/g.45981 Transcript_35817/m.45981 type:complete len:233 (+) Transcript_35817:1218-1916(+)
MGRVASRTPAIIKTTPTSWSPWTMVMPVRVFPVGHLSPSAHWSPFKLPAELPPTWVRPMSKGAVVKPAGWGAMVVVPMIACPTTISVAQRYIPLKVTMWRPAHRTIPLFSSAPVSFTIVRWRRTHVASSIEPPAASPPTERFPRARWTVPEESVRWAPTPPLLMPTSAPATSALKRPSSATEASPPSRVGSHVAVAAPLSSGREVRTSCREAAGVAAPHTCPQHRLPSRLVV